MAWETRNGRSYYYQKNWRNGTCVNSYVGTGLLGELASIIDTKAAHQRTLQRLEQQHFIQKHQRVDSAINDFHAGVQQAVSVALQALGYHRHKRQWRRKRTESIDSMANEVAVQAGREIFQEYNNLLGAASVAKPKPDDLERLREYGFAHPGIFAGFSPLAKLTIDGVLDASGVNEATKIHLKGEIRSLESGLGYKEASELERLLIRDIVICWLRLWFFESIYTSNYKTGEGVTFAKSDYLEKRLSATQRRYLRAIESLAHVRGLLVRAGIQINVANNQVVQNG